MGMDNAMCQVANSSLTTCAQAHWVRWIQRVFLSSLAIIDTVHRGPDDQSSTDLAMMRRALIAAEGAAERDEVPVGAVVARGEEILAVAANERETTKDPTAHAELLAIRYAAAASGGWRLAGCTLYSTLEPCPMCAGAAHAARIDRLVYAAPDPKAGYAGTLHNVPADPHLNHAIIVVEGVLEAEAAELLRVFFRDRREKPRRTPPSPPRGCPDDTQ